MTELRAGKKCEDWKEVRQGCCLSLFEVIVYREYLIKDLGTSKYEEKKFALQNA
jgi:hypothetical protein